MTDDEQRPGRLPTREECWEAFWDRLAAIWLELPQETRRRIAELDAPARPAGRSDAAERAVPRPET